MKVLPPWDPGWREFRLAFEAEWLSHLIEHHGSWCHASEVAEPEDTYERALLGKLAHEVVLSARRLGLVVESDRGHGYRLTAHAGLPRYLHLHERAEERAEEPWPDQLTLVECGVG